MTAETKKVIIADDHEAFLNGMKKAVEEIPEFEVLATALNGRELVELCKLHQPDIVFTDIKMPVMDGPTATREILSVLPDTLIMAVSSYDDDCAVLDTFIAGAKGFIPKGAPCSQILEAVEQASNIDGYYCGTKSVTLHAYIKKYTYGMLPEDAALFTKRELEIFQMLGEGLTSKDIATRLFISPRTVSGHRENLLAKTKCRNGFQLILYAFRNGLIRDT